MSVIIAPVVCELDELDCKVVNFIRNSFQDRSGVVHEHSWARLISMMTKKQNRQQGLTKRTVVEPISGNPNAPVYQIQFKNTESFCEPSHYAMSPYGVGDFVIVKSKSKAGGLHVGMVTGVKKRADFHKHSQLGAILKTATFGDITSLMERNREENMLLDICKAFKDRFPGLVPMTVLDVEFQFDRTKLFIYYSTTSRVDYREFLRCMYTFCKCYVMMIRRTATNRN